MPDHGFTLTCDRNKAIINPDKFAINSAKMRCLTKCFAMFGLGHYIYAGEDLPQAVQNAVITREQSMIIRDLITETDSDYYKFCKAFKCETVDDLLSSHFDRAVAALEAKKK